MNGEKFVEAGKIEAGELIFRFPGTQFVMPYNASPVFLDRAKKQAYTLLRVTDMIPKYEGEATGLMGMLGRQLAGMTDNTETREAHRKLFKTHPITIFYSREGSLEFLTIPGLSQQDSMDLENFPNIVVGMYAQDGSVKSTDEVHLFHNRIIGDRRLQRLDDEIFSMVPKANEVYRTAEKVMRELPF